MLSELAQLPDFLEALTTEASPRASPVILPTSPPGSPDRSSPRLSLSASKLRYAAYDPPQVVSRLRRPSSSQRSYSSSSRSGTYSNHGGTNSRLSVASEERSSVDELSRTVTAGDLALAAGDIEQEMMAKVSYSVCTCQAAADRNCRPGMRALHQVTKLE
jgi:AP-4 complex subunit epsilon-1